MIYRPNRPSTFESSVELLDIGEPILRRLRAAGIASIRALQESDLYELGFNDIERAVIRRELHRFKPSPSPSPTPPRAA